MNKYHQYVRNTLVFLIAIVSCFSTTTYENPAANPAISPYILTLTTKKIDSPNNPLLVVVLMVKNEANVIVDTLHPFLEGGVDSFFIFDTGSTDATIQLATDFFTQEQARLVKTVIAQEPFIDFATSRNRALELAHQQFPNAAFMVMPDAEWYIEHADKLLEFCKNNLHTKHPSYGIKIRDANLEFYVERLIRCGTNSHFAGAVHECITNGSAINVSEPVCFDRRVSDEGYKKTANRFKRDLDLLLKDYTQNPNNPRTVFYLAQTYECLGDQEMAYKMYAHRITLPGWDEENYVALYRLAKLTQDIHPDNTQWPLAESRYLQAWDMRPHRAEPLIEIARYYLHKKYHRCFLYALQACEIAYPENERLFVNKKLYDYDRWDILGQAAWYYGKYQHGENAVTLLLNKYPDHAHLQRNLSLYKRVKTN